MARKLVVGESFGEAAESSVSTFQRYLCLAVAPSDACACVVEDSHQHNDDRCNHLEDRPYPRRY